MQWRQRLLPCRTARPVLSETDRLVNDEDDAASLTALLDENASELPEENRLAHPVVSTPRWSMSPGSLRGRGSC